MNKQVAKFILSQIANVDESTWDSVNQDSGQRNGVNCRAYLDNNGANVMPDEICQTLGLSNNTTVRTGVERFIEIQKEQAALGSPGFIETLFPIGGKKTKLRLISIGKTGQLTMAVQNLLDTRGKLQLLDDNIEEPPILPRQHPQPQQQRSRIPQGV